MKKFLLIKPKTLFFLLFFIFSASPALADECFGFGNGEVSCVSAPAVVAPVITSVSNLDTIFSIEPVKVDFDSLTAAKGVEAISSDGRFKVIAPANTLGNGGSLELIGVSDQLASPWKLDRVSGIYQFDFSSESNYGGKMPITLRINYEQVSNGYKRIFFYDSNLKSWRELLSTDFPDQKIVEAKINFSYARVAIFSDPAIQLTGKASWYAYKKGDFAASIDFPKGSRLRVFNLDNNKSVDITINDFGPERDKFPDRILDLDKVAFKKLASTGLGTINIRIQPLYVAPDSNGRVLGVAIKGALAAPDVKASSAIVIDEKSGQTIWEKNADAVLSLASLSKLVAIKVFFDQHPSLNTVVAYKKQDELNNYKYCKPEESARLTVKDGETMTIENLVYAALVGSANNAVESLVRVSGISRDAFIAQMNSYAVSVGATSTHFEEPTGLSAKNVSTAREYAIIIREIFKNPVIQKISVMPKYSFTTINTKKKHTFSNTNNFIRDGVFAAMNNLKVTGSKTGYLDQYNLMTRVAGSKGDMLIAVVFGATTKMQSLEETKELIQYGLRKIDTVEK